MLFSSISFLYYFLPIILIVYFLVPYKYKNAALLIGSLIFYFLGEPKYTIILILSSLVDYTHSIIIDKNRGTKIAKRALISSVVINLSILGFFKYTDFFISNINLIFDANFKLLNISLPIGISFFTFQTMSYTIDVYRDEAKVQKNPIAIATYISLFPQLIAGPIVRYKTVAEELNSRVHSFDMFSYGVRRFIIGLAKKVLIANELGKLSIIAIESPSPSLVFYWISAVAFSLQIYFDFSGYSDMAIGLGRMFGFNFLENFNYPYISKSITEFWRRWHISLGEWFRDYLYIPLGGNKVSKLKWFRNIALVWFLTGFWHGASWNYIIWGMYFGIILVLEKIFISKLLSKIPALLNHLYVLFIVIISFVIFNNEDLAMMLIQLKGMFALLDIPFINAETIYYLRSYMIVILISIITSTPIIKLVIDKLSTRKELKVLMDSSETIFSILTLLLVSAHLIDSSFNPFLYFRF